MLNVPASAFYNSIVVELVADDKHAHTITVSGAKTVEGSIRVKAGGIRRANEIIVTTDDAKPIATTNNSSSADDKNIRTNSEAS